MSGTKLYQCKIFIAFVNYRINLKNLDKGALKLKKATNISIN